MTDATDHMTRPGAGPRSYMFSVGGIPTSYSINFNPESGRVEVAKTMPRGVDDELAQDFLDKSSALTWADAEFYAARLR
jgi:hypothetical protein